MKNKIVIHDTDNTQMKTKLSSSTTHKVKIYIEGLHNANFTQAGLKIKQPKTETRSVTIFGIPNVKIVTNTASTKTLFTN